MLGSLQVPQTMGSQILERRSLGQILIASGAIVPEDLRNVIGQQIEQAVAEVMVWDTGTFEFAIVGGPPRAAGGGWPGWQRASATG